MSSLRAITTIAKRELSSYFNSPLAYFIIVIYLLLAGVVTFQLGGFFERGEASLTNSFFIFHPWLYLILVPAIGMRLWSDEQRTGTLELLLTLPVTPWQAIVGKFLSSWFVIGLALVLTFPAVLTVDYLGNPDWGVIASGYLGSFLIAGTFLGISSLTSALTRSQMISYLVSLVICLSLILIGLPGMANRVADVVGSFLNLFAPLAEYFSISLQEVGDTIRRITVETVSVVSDLSVDKHYRSFQRGVVDTRDVLYYLSVIAFTLFATSVVIHSKRSR